MNDVKDEALSVENKRSEVSRPRLILLERMTRVIIVFLSVLVAYFALLFFLFSRLDGPKTIDKEQLFSRMETAIKNGADFDDIRQIFGARSYIRGVKSFFQLFDRTESSSQYREPLNLSDVLKDMRAELFVKGNADLDLAAKYRKFVDEHEKRNPFDKLEGGQRVHFETMQAKIGEKYVIVQQDVNRIVDELASKNELVNKYLSDSTLSFRLSIVALALSAFAFIPQLTIFFGWTTRKWKALFPKAEE